VDIWSSGVIAYILLFGKMPFDLDSTSNKIKSYQFTFPVSRVSQNAKNFITNMLQIDISKRLTASELLAHPFLNLNDIPKNLPKSTLACPPNSTFLNQFKQQNCTLGYNQSENK